MSSEKTPPSSSSSQLLITAIQKSLDSCSKAVEAGDFRQSESAVSDLVECLSSVSDATISYSVDEDNINKQDDIDNSHALLSHILAYLSHPSLDQAVVDALLFELPKAVAKFAGVSQSCCETVDSILDIFVAKCNPRDMMPVFCEALNEYGKTTDAPGYVPSLLRGFSKVFSYIQRRHFEQIKVTVPVLLNASLSASLDLDDDDDIGLKNLFEGSVSIANSIQATCEKLEGETNEKLRGLLGLYVLRNMTIISTRLGKKVSSCLTFVQQLSSFFPYCRLLYADLIIGQGVNSLISLVYGDSMDDPMDCFSYVKHGALLSVIWGHISDEVVQAAGQDLNILKDELRATQSRRWLAIGMMKYLFYMSELPWVLKKHALEFLLFITENLDQEEIDEDICSIHTPSLICTLQAILSLIMSAPTAEPRKTAFAALKKVLADIPATLRLDMMQVLVMTSSSASMVAILLDCVRENLRNDYSKLKEAKICSTNSFWGSGILELVEFVLRPSNGGPPSLPEQSDAVLSALNLYRYVFITESTGKTNYTEVLSRTNLLKTYHEWLLPLRTMITGIMAENKSDDEHHGFDIMCGLNPVEFVLYRCIELLEENIKQSSEPVASTSAV